MSVTEAEDTAAAGEDAPDLDAQIKDAERLVSAAEDAERAAATGPDQGAHHVAADAARWAQGQLSRLRDLKAKQDAEEAARRRQAATEEAERILTEAGGSDAVVSAYRDAGRALEALVAACGRRQDALVEAGRVLRRGGHDVPSTNAPVLMLPSSGMHDHSDADAGPLSLEIFMDAALRHRLRSQGRTSIESLLGGVTSRTARGRIGRLAAERSAPGAVAS